MFHQLTLVDKNRICEKLAEEEPLSCNYSFGTIYIWMHLGLSEVAEIEGCIILRHRFGRQEFYSIPLGGGNKKKAVECMMHIAHSEGKTLKMRPILMEEAKWLAKEFPGRFSVSASRDEFDYVYLKADLAELKGRHYHGKRNHIKHFTENYNWSYEALNENNLAECALLEEEWLKTRDRADKGAFMEAGVVKRALENFSALDFFGGLLRVDGRPVAFTVAERLNKNTVDVHIEKALVEYVGAYAAINKFFAQNECADFEFINREDDVGDEGLRKAKLSYRPAFLIEKYGAEENPHPFVSQEELCAVYSAAAGGRTLFSNDGTVVVHKNESEWYGRICISGKGEYAASSLKGALSECKAEGALPMAVLLKNERGTCAPRPDDAPASEDARQQDDARDKDSARGNPPATDDLGNPPACRSGLITDILIAAGYKESMTAPGMILDFRNLEESRTASGMAPDLSNIEHLNSGGFQYEKCTATAHESFGDDGVVTINENNIDEWRRALNAGYSTLGADLVGDNWDTEGDGTDYTLFPKIPEITLLGFKAGGKIVGTLVLFTGKTASVHEVAVIPEYRRRGAARSMMRAAIKVAVSRGYDKISLLATEEGFPLYESLGFRKCCEISHWKAIPEN